MAKKVAKKATKKAASSKKKKSPAKRAAGQRGRRLASEGSPKFDPKKHIRLSALAKKCNISYQSMYLKQKRTNVNAIATNDNGVEVMAFTLEDARKIEEAKAKPMRADSIALQDLEQELKVSRPKLMGVLYKLRIFAVKRQGNDNRQTLTVTQTEAEKVKESINS